MSFKVNILGSGNLATHLAKELYNKGHSILNVYSLHIKNAKALASKVKSKGTDDIKSISSDADITFLCLTDSATRSLKLGNEFKKSLIVHCSGTLDIKSIEHLSDRVGVFYPLQTFSKGVKVDWNLIPLFIETKKVSDNKLLNSIAKQLGKEVHYCSSENRAKLHLSAVLVNNFVNHLYTLSSDYLKANNLKFDYLQSLMLQTLENSLNNNPSEVQTGPAKRGDTLIMDRHLTLLKEDKELKNIYQVLSKSITKYHGSK